LGENNGNANDNGSAICTINNGVDVELFHNAEPLRDFQTDKFVVVMVAGFRPQKDQDTFIKAMSLLSSDQYEAWLVGDGERRTSLQLMVDNLRLQEQVKFIGLRTDVPNILKTADVVVMSTHYEGLSLSNIEGMAAGKPFVASDVEGIHEVTQGYGILFPHEDAKALADIIMQLHDDAAYRQDVATRCYERARQFDIGNMVKEYNEVYGRVFSF
jgi:glycosyltransferase involved in cell wall biosynthesis